MQRRLSIRAVIITRSGATAYGSNRRSFELEDIVVERMLVLPARIRCQGWSTWKLEGKFEDCTAVMRKIDAGGK
jgi:hypothetical protein